MERDYILKDGKYELFQAHANSKKYLLNSSSSYLNKKCYEKLQKVEFIIEGLNETLKSFKFILKTVFISFFFLCLLLFLLKITNKLKKKNENKNLFFFENNLKKSFYNCKTNELFKNKDDLNLECDFIKIDNINNNKNGRLLSESNQRKNNNNKNLEDKINIKEDLKILKIGKKYINEQKIFEKNIKENSSFKINDNSYILREKLDENKFFKIINYLLIFNFCLFIGISTIYKILKTISIKKMEKDLKNFFKIENENSDLIMKLGKNYKKINFKLKENSQPTIISLNISDFYNDNEDILNDSFYLNKKNISKSFNKSFKQSYCDIDDFDSSLSLISPAKHMKYKND